MVRFLESTLKGAMPNSLDRPVVQDELLETFSGGTELSLEEMLRLQESLIHTFDKNGPRLREGPEPLGLGEVIQFSRECAQWCRDHPDFLFGGRMRPL
ncbi:hypothetical protein ABC383_04085 [Noviherbaspirillum sp. 1P10PC]|uniref:hypothetical protein n=1 Tax=Noviherbaspirillum sp. 1P10PC TaxID=3132292 RepID=UPI00399F3923